MNIKILGPGCSNCRVLFRNTQEAVKSLNITAEVEKIEDYAQMMSYGILGTPALVIDEVLVSSGRVNSVTEISELLQAKA
ncbi:TM0996/MTH895 family glutaredoxin-like protein [bacterium]|nr:TM0996/MTH895 family glutaredoxin-like protein [bacterium]